MPEEKSGAIAQIRILGCANGVTVTLETERQGLIGRVRGPDLTEYVARDLPDLEMVFQRIMGNERVAAALSRCFEGRLAVKE